MSIWEDHNMDHLEPEGSDPAAEELSAEKAASSEEEFFHEDETPAGEDFLSDTEEPAVEDSVTEPGETAWEDLEGNPEQNPEEDPEEFPEENLEETQEDIPEEVLEEDPENIPEEDLEEDPENIPEEDLEEDPENIPEEDLEEDPDDIPEEDLEEDPDDIPVEDPEDILEEESAPDEAPATEDSPEDTGEEPANGFTMRDPDPDSETIGSNFTMHDPDEDAAAASGADEENPGRAGSPEEGKTVNTRGINKKGWSQRIQRRLPADPEAEAERRKRMAITLILVGILAVAVSSLLFFYNRALQKPAKATSEFLGAIQEMDFDKMSSLLLDEDITALENADVTSPAYQAFFKDINSQLSFKIRGVSLNMGEGTARVTAHLRYADGTELYKAVVTEFLRDIVSSAFSGENLENVDTQEKLAALLAAKEDEMGLQFAETEITYPLIKREGKWKIVTLDDQTVKIMSASFKNIEEEISSSLENSAAEASGEKSLEEAGAALESTSDLVNFQSVVTLALDTDTFSVKYDSSQISEDYAGNECLLYYYIFTNKSEDATSAMANVNLQAYQNGENLEPAIPNNNDKAFDNFMAEVGPGESLLICQAFTLTDHSNVSVQVRPSFSFDAEGASTQTLKLE